MGSPTRYQPQGLARLNASPLRRGLVSYMPLTGKSYTDVSDGSAWTLVPGTFPSFYEGAPRGMGLRVKGVSTSYVTRPAPAAITVSTTQPVTFRYRLFLHKVGITGVLSWGNIPQDPAPRYYARVNGSNILSIYLNSYNDVDVIVPEREYIVTHTFDGTLHSFYLDGVLKKTAGGSWTGNASTLYLGDGYDGTTAANTDFVLSDFAVWNRALSASEVASDARNPWQMFDAGSGGSAYQAAIAAVSAPASGGSYTATLADALTIDDIRGSTFFTSAQVADILSAATQTSASATLSAAGVEAITVGDVSSTSGSGTASILESVSITEALGVLAAASAALNDAITPTDTSSTSGNGSASSSDSLSITDSRVSQVQALSSLLDSLGVTDQTYIAGSAYATAGSDVLTIGDLRAGQFAGVVNTSDNLTTTEQLAASLFGKQDVTINANQVSSSHWVVFQGGTRLVVFNGGTRVVIFKGGVSRVVPFAGSNKRVVFASTGWRKIVKF